MKIDTSTSTYGVFGDPVGHSLSPLMHNAAFCEKGLNSIYLGFLVKDIAMAVEGVRGLGIKGASITIPHKISVMEYLDEIDRTASAIGAVNTIVNNDGRLIGFNTDCSGGINALKEKTTINGQKVVILGAGGAARALGFGIKSNGADLTIVNRSVEKGKKLAGDLGAKFGEISCLADIEYDILINTTSVGMSPADDSMPVRSRDLKKDKVVMDIIYNPLKTRLIKEAEKLGCTIVDGVSMFVFQGAAQFSLWTGLDAPVSLMRKVVFKHLENNHL